MENLDLINSFSEFKELKNIDKQTMQHILEDVFRAMFKRKFNTDEHIDIIVNIDKGDVQIFLNKEIVDDEINGFLYEEVSNVKAIITKVMSDINIFNKISSNNYDVVEQKYLLDLVKDKEVEIYRKLIKN